MRLHILCQGDYAQNVIASQVLKTAKRTRPEWSDEQAFEAAKRVGETIIAEHGEEASRQLGKSLARDYNDKAGIFCLAAIATDMLMWSHYANHHRGICLEFRTNVKDSIFRKAQPVTYREEYPQLDLRKLVEDEDFREATPWMLTKSSFWSYEGEWRILDFENGPRSSTVSTRVPVRRGPRMLHSRPGTQEGFGLGSEVPDPSSTPSSQEVQHEFPP